MTQPPRPPPDLDALYTGIRVGNRAALGRAITLIESRRHDHRRMAQALLDRLMPHTGAAHRVGITGVPGAGKSTFIDAFGSNLTAAGHRVAVLAVDPSSNRSGGSILGDKTRMARLSNDPDAFIRPSPAAGTLGGVHRATRETMLVCEAAGFDVILVETVGVGQSETVVHEMVDFFLVLMLAGAGDELQGIKKGVLELADMVAINKADGDNELRARLSARDYQAALRLLTPINAAWKPPVVLCSGLNNRGLGDIWEQIRDHRRRLEDCGAFADNRRQQQLRWMWAMVDERLRDALRRHPQVLATLPELEASVLAGHLAPTSAVTALLAAFGLPDQ